jgi:hypothetical protein
LGRLVGAPGAIELPEQGKGAGEVVGAGQAEAARPGVDGGKGQGGTGVAAIAGEIEKSLPDAAQVRGDFRPAGEGRCDRAVARQIVKPVCLLAPFEMPEQAVGQFFASASRSAVSASPTRPAA